MYLVLAILVQCLDHDGKASTHPVANVGLYTFTKVLRRCYLLRNFLFQVTSLFELVLEIYLGTEPVLELWLQVSLVEVP